MERNTAASEISQGEPGGRVGVVGGSDGLGWVVCTRDSRV
jgi:hypothetical protein